jgi:protoheme IX farnesyltransferase
MSAIFSLFKLRLTLLVLVSAVMGYLMGCNEVDTGKIIGLLFGGLLLTGGSNGMNQVFEREYDALMNRTKNRPIPSGKMSVMWASIISFFSGLLGIAILWVFISATCGILGLFAFLSYVFLYTPMKRMSSLAVFVGAFPGAIPPMLGYVAATDDFGLAPGLLFATQFMWQFPHFWAIAWVSHEDYVRGGYKLLPFSEGPSKRNAFQIFLYSLFLIPVSLLPWALPLHAPMTGTAAAITTTAAGLVMAYYAQRLYAKGEMKFARAVMFTSFFYLPIVQLAYVLDRMS